jgi:hypothetical protein
MTHPVDGMRTGCAVLLLREESVVRREQRRVDRAKRLHPALQL